MTVRLDAVVTTNDGPAYILHNETSTQNHWLTLRLVGGPALSCKIPRALRATVYIKLLASVADCSTAQRYFSGLLESEVQGECRSW